MMLRPGQLDFLSGKTGDKRALHLLAAIGIVLVGAWLRFVQLGAASLWGDEALSVYYAGLPWSTLWLSSYDFAPPLYYSLLKLFLYFGDSEFIIRLPGVLAGILTLPLIYRAGHLVGGSWAGLGAALVLALSPVQIEYSQEARAYSLLVLNLTLALVGLLLLLRQSEGSSLGPGRNIQPPRYLLGGLVYGVGILLALYTHNISVFFIFCVQLVVFRHWWRHLGCERRFLLVWLAINAGVFLLWLPWLKIILFESFLQNPYFWLDQADLKTVLTRMCMVHGIPSRWSQSLINQSLIVVWSLVLVSLWSIGAYHLRGRGTVLLLLLSIMLLGPLLIWLVGFLQPLYLVKTIFWSGLGSALLLGVAMARFGGFRAVLILLVIGAGFGKAAWSFHAMERAENDDWKGAYAWLQQQGHLDQETHAVLLCEPWFVDAMDYYARHQTPAGVWLGWDTWGSETFTSRVMERRTADNSAPGMIRSFPAGRGGIIWKRKLSDRTAWQAATWTGLAVITRDSPTSASSFSALQEVLDSEGWELESSATLKKQLKLYSYRCGKGCFLPERKD